MLHREFKDRSKRLEDERQEDKTMKNGHIDVKIQQKYVCEETMALYVYLC